jgi:hypothetical protein
MLRRHKAQLKQSVNPTFQRLPGSIPFPGGTTGFLDSNIVKIHRESGESLGTQWTDRSKNVGWFSFVNSMKVLVMLGFVPQPNLRERLIETHWSGGNCRSI